MLDELYQELIIDHGTKPRNHHALDNHTHKAEGYNPLCGDKVTVYLEIENNIIQKVSFEGSGCAISVASASIMSDILKGLSKPEVLSLAEKFSELVTGKEPNLDELPLKLHALGGVKEFPMRVKCATLAWHTLKSAISAHSDNVSTE